MKSTGEITLIDSKLVNFLIKFRSVVMKYCCWLLASGFWLLASGGWLLAAGCWLLVAGCWLSRCAGFRCAQLVVLLQGIGFTNISCLLFYQITRYPKGNRYAAVWFILFGFNKL
jgi:hypothetical protein